jgi:hypothetical protein
MNGGTLVVVLGLLLIVLGALGGYLNSIVPIGHGLFTSAPALFMAGLLMACLGAVLAFIGGGRGDSE